MGGKAHVPGRGRPPKTKRQRELNGNAGKRPINDSEPDFTEAVNNELECPKWIGNYGKEMWKRIVPEVQKAGIICVTDIHNIEVFCAAYNNWRLAQLELATDGITSINSEGTRSKHPAATVANESARQMVTFGSLLGLDPSSRTRLIGSSGQKEDNPFEGY